MEMVHKSDVKPFVDAVRKHLDAEPTIIQQAPPRTAELKDLADLLKEGLITREEFDTAKARILDGD